MGIDTLNIIRNEIKAKISESGYSLKYVVDEMNKKRDMEHQTTTQNISNKLTRGTIKYSEVKEIAEILGYKIEWKKEV